MNAEIGIMEILKNDSSVTALVDSGSSSRIYYDEAMEGQQLPFIILQVDEIQPNDTKSGISTLDEDFVYVTTFAGTKKDAKILATAARAALDRTTGTKNGIQIIGLQFRTQRSDTDRLVDKKVFTIEQLYKVMTQQ